MWYNYRHLEAELTEETVKTMDAYTRHSAKARILPNLGVLALCEVILYFLPATKIGPIIGFLFTFVYLSVIAIITRRAVTHPDDLHPLDRSLFRWSGPVAFAILLLLAAAVAPTAFNRHPQDNWVTTPLGVFVVKFAVEAGFVLSVACCFAPPRPACIPSVRSMFDLCAYPLLPVYGMFVALILIGQICDEPLLIAVAAEPQQAKAKLNP